MDEIIALAEQLGGKIAATEPFTALRAAQKAIDADDDAKALLRQLEEKAREMAELEARQKPIEPALKHALQDAREKVHAHPILQELARAEADYMALMNRVNSALHGALHKDDPAPTS